MSASPPLPRPGISVWTATSLVVANIIGTGVFTSLGFQVAGLPSGFAILALWLVGGVCALCGAFCYGELAAALPRSGGEYYFLSRIYHPAAGFLAGWISITVGFAAPVALAAMAFGRYAHGTFPVLDPLGVSLAVVALVTAVHLGGPGIGSAFQNVATVLKIALLLGLVVAGAFAGSGEPVSFLPGSGDWPLLASAPFAVSLVYVMYAYSGWNAATYIVSEVRDPGRTVPLAVLAGTLLVTVLYLAVNATFLRTTPMAEMAGRMEVAQVASTHIFGGVGSRIMSGLICAGLVSSISAMTWIGPRVAMAMGQDFAALRGLARLNGRGVPWVALGLQGGIVTALVTTSTFAAVLTYVQFTLQLCSFAAVLGVIVLRVREPDLPRPCRTWGYPVTPLIFLGVSAWMLVHIAMSDPLRSAIGVATMAVGLGVYFAVRKGASRA